MENNLVSIIIPIYKVKEEYVSKCINSIKNQTYKNIEILCMFDGSDKKTIEYCKKIIGDDKRFIIYSRENKGVSITRNEGIIKSNGEWITFVDADDWLEENAIEIFINHIKQFKENIEFMIFKTFINNNNNETQNECKYSENHIINDSKKKELFQSTFGTKYGKYSYCESVWKNFYKKSTLINNNITFPNNIQVAEDMLFNYQVWEKCGNGYYVNKPIYHYRINDESVMNSDAEKLLNKYEKLYPTLENSIKNVNNKYTENYSNFIIKQIKRFLFIYTQKEKNFLKFKKMIKKQYYKDHIKKAKLSSMNYKNLIFLLILKLKLYFLLPVLSKLYKI